MQSPLILAGGANTVSSTVNAATTSSQTVAFTCSTTPCFAAGVLNTIGKTFDWKASGQFGFNTNTGISVGIEMNVGQGTAAPGQFFGGWTQNGLQYWTFDGTCTVTATGATGTLLCDEEFYITDGNGGAHIMPAFVRVISSSINLTAAISPQTYIQFTTASTGNTFTQNYAVTHQQN